MFNIALRCHIDFLGTKEDILYLIIYTDDLLTNITVAQCLLVLHNTSYSILCTHIFPQTYKFSEEKRRELTLLIFEQACILCL